MICLSRLFTVVSAFFVLFVSSASVQATDLLYVTLSNNTIVRYNTTGTNGATIAATVAVFANSNLNVPVGLAFDSSGNLYAANNSGSTISKFNSAGVYQSAGSIGSTNLNFPNGLAFDSSGNLYAANNFGNTISKFDSNGTLLATIGTTNNLNGPVGLTLDSSNNLYVANNGTSTIFKFNSAGVYQSTGSIGSANLSSPYGLAIDSSGNLYAANYNNATISKFDAAGNFLTSWSTGTSNFPLALAFQPTIVPEPSTYALATIAVGVLSIIARRRRA